MRSYLGAILDDHARNLEACPRGQPRRSELPESARGQELFEILLQSNGFGLFENSIVVFPSGAPGFKYNLDLWNSPECWYFAYGISRPLFFFAEDLFGNQFYIEGDEVGLFDAETAQTNLFASSMDEWARLILTDWEYISGFPILRDWKKSGGQLSWPDRLVPKIPFVLGGKFDPSNLYAVERARGMRIRGEISRQIRDLPEGSTVRLNIVP